MKLNIGLVKYVMELGLKVSRDHKFFLKVALVFLGASVILPFATGHFYIFTYVSVPGYGLPTEQYKVFHWSFMTIEFVSQETAFHAEGWKYNRTNVLLFTENWYVPESLGFNILISTFILQIILLPMGFITLKKSTRTRSSIPLLLGVTTLNILYLYYCFIFSRSVSFGFYLSIIATLFVLIDLVRAKKWI